MWRRPSRRPTHRGGTAQRGSLLRPLLLVRNRPEKIEKLAAVAHTRQFTGAIRIDRAGKYNFYTRSDDGSRLYLNGKQLIDNDGLHGPVEKGGSAVLQPGVYPLLVTYFDNGGGDGLDVTWSGPGFSKQKIPASRLVIPAAETLQDVAIRALSALPVAYGTPWGCAGRPEC